MVKLTLFLLKIIFATSAVLSNSAESGHDLEYIGTFKSKSRLQGRSKVFDDTNYYVSPNAASWNNAGVDCKNYLGPSATLLAIESEEEWVYVKGLLEGYGFGTTYWTSGTYDPSITLWKWSGNGQSLQDFSAWGPSYPNTPNSLLRVLLYYTNKYEAHWRTAASTQLHRYICEVDVLPSAVMTPCYKTSDLAIVLDASGSIGYNYFETIKVHVQRLADAFTAYTGNRLVFITYSDYATTRIKKTNTLSRKEISSIIRYSPWEGGSTATYSGINLAIDELTSSRRRHVPLNMVVFTSGYSAFNGDFEWKEDIEWSNNVDDAWPYYTVDAADRARNEGIRTFSVRLSPYSNEHELVLIAGGDSSRVFTTENIDELIELLAPANQRICPEVVTFNERQ